MKTIYAVATVALALAAACGDDNGSEYATVSVAEFCREWRPLARYLLNADPRVDPDPGNAMEVVAELGSRVDNPLVASEAARLHELLTTDPSDGPSPYGRDTIMDAVATFSATCGVP